MNEPVSFSPTLCDFIATAPWTFAKTYAATWPHEYIVRKRVDEEMFVRLVSHIRTHGYEGNFYRMKITYYDEDGMTYWTMGAPIETETVINRCPKENTYEVRLRNGTLPESTKKPGQ